MLALFWRSCFACQRLTAKSPDRETHTQSRFGEEKQLWEIQRFLKRVEMLASERRSQGASWTLKVPARRKQRLSVAVQVPEYWASRQRRTASECWVSGPARTVVACLEAELQTAFLQLLRAHQASRTD